LIALCLPVGLLYLRLVFGLAASDSRLSASDNTRFEHLSMAALAVFVIAQVVAALYLKRMFPPRPGFGAQALQYTGALVIGILFSLTGAISLEAFGFAFFLRGAGGHR
jgi:hypothetical protein